MALVNIKFKANGDTEPRKQVCILDLTGEEHLLPQIGDTLLIRNARLNVHSRELTITHGRVTGIDIITNLDEEYEYLAHPSPSTGG